MSFVSLAAIIIGGIILGAILMSFLRGVMYFVIAILSIGIAYYLFIASPQEKVKMDNFAQKVSNSIYNVDKIDIDKYINQTKEAINKMKEKIQENIKK